MRRSLTASACLLALALVGACGSGEETPDTPARTGAVTNTAAPADSDTDSDTGTDTETGGVVLDVRIADGVVQPTNIRLDAAVGEPIVLRVTSDAVDELHVHSVPEHTFPVEATGEVGADPGVVQEFEFVVDVPGQTAVELHDAGVTVATLLVRP
ncbi:hypothetical protein G4H71_00590 [Rhodococcus triatomae]|uniref:EfeO-type cupredoxin-like domain-containing protein n=1 Tax=Rhodococcus triatomae TaxID=300028 RepID=A0A1G8CVF9_9NOCA|nr:hypothetical protein [Rhodococcus triatomae]QNG18575.1 hypothetical protein G4H72_07460 [Rhodococcus triatomae]QNG21756.1 hypothetical protein G4H71_00590 [Rhodococcus triatomae]SDH49169.1 hypothetical protein SAMN05444695_102120 [Rhodococcus triatomae]